MLKSLLLFCTALGCGLQVVAQDTLLVAYAKKHGSSQSAYGYVDSEGKWLIEPQYEMAFQFKANRALVRKDNRHFYVKPNGTPVSDSTYLKGWNF